MRRDLRRFLCVGWTLLDVPAYEALSLGAEWKRRRGHVPPDRLDVTRGYHFCIPRGRAVHVVARGNAVNEAALARVCALVATKYRVEARPAEEAELPRLPSAQLPIRLASDRLEEWPPPDDELKDELVLEYVEGGLFVPVIRTHSSGFWAPPTNDPALALVFATLEEADAWSHMHAPMERLQPRYRAAALAESDLREASGVESW